MDVTLWVGYLLSLFCIGEGSCEMVFFGKSPERALQDGYRICRARERGNQLTLDSVR